MNPQATILRSVSSCALVATMIAGLTARAEVPDGQDGMAEIGGWWWPPLPVLSAPFVRGDANLSGAAELGDAIFILQHLFYNGPEPECMAAADIDSDSKVDIVDPIFLLAYLYYGGRSPAAPYPYCGDDPSPSGLGCARYIACVPPPCPDPAAEAIEFEIVSRPTPFAGEVRIIGRMRNVGGPFVSHPGEQRLLLYEQSAGGHATLVARVEFQNLDPGETLEVTYVRSWDTTSFDLLEFPPKYMLQILYDPDIKEDGLEQNDDCVHDNNLLGRSGSDINELFD